MLEKYVFFKVLDVFMRYPYNEFYLREMAKKAGISPSVASGIMEWLVKNRFVERKNIGNLSIFRADYGHNTFKHFKIAMNMLKLENSGFVDYISLFEPFSVVLYGSFARGEDDENSDIDILIISNRNNLYELQKFEKQLENKINVQVFTPKKWESKTKFDKPFHERVVIEGITLYGQTVI